jgi:hypothetical protein
MLGIGAPAFAQTPAPAAASQDQTAALRARRSNSCVNSSTSCRRRLPRSRPRERKSPRRLSPRRHRRRRRRRRLVSKCRPARPAPVDRPGLLCGNTSALSKIFNPDMAVIGNFVGAAGKNDIAPLPALKLNEAEMSFQAIVDPYARADFFLSASPEGLEVEEGFITFPTLPGGLLMKVGKMKAQFGKVNTMHSHTQPWVDTPLPMVNLLGGEGAERLQDLRLGLIMNPVMFLEARRGLQQRQQPLQELQTAISATSAGTRLPTSAVDEPGPRYAVACGHNDASAVRRRG